MYPVLNIFNFYSKYHGLKMFCIVYVYYTIITIVMSRGSIVYDHKVYHFGNENNKHIYGVSLIALRRMKEYIIYFISVSESNIVIVGKSNIIINRVI